MESEEWLDQGAQFFSLSIRSVFCCVGLIFRLHLVASGQLQVRHHTYL